MPVYTSSNMTRSNVTYRPADLMPRNLVRRVELMTPILEDNLMQKIEQILMLQLADNTLRWELQSDGNYNKNTATW